MHANEFFGSISSTFFGSIFFESRKKYIYKKKREREILLKSISKFDLYVKSFQFKDNFNKKNKLFLT